MVRAWMAMSGLNVHVELEWAMLRLLVQRAAEKYNSTSTTPVSSE